MEICKIFNDLESNQTLECEEAKKKLVDFFGQNKEQWLVNYMMEYYLKTGSLRIMEVLVRVQSPHDVYLFDRLAEWLKTQANRVHALNLFSFVVRRHPTWLYKVEKHRLIKDILKLLLTEKDIVPLMSSLLCIITLLPIIPYKVPNFLNELFDVFGHLAAWNCQNPNRLPDDKIVHLQLGLQLLFHKLYGMYPCNFVTYLSEFVKKERNSVFHHTIKPLLETVRMHPLLVTATAETEVNTQRWKEMEPHDVVMECVKQSLPVKYQDCYAEHTYQLPPTDVSEFETSSRSTSVIRTVPSNNSLNKQFSNAIEDTFNQQLQQQDFALQSYGRISRFDSNTNAAKTTNSNTIWSPYNEINTSGPIPVTPTPSHALTSAATTSAANLNNQILGVTGSSPPEAAVEATPETTPMKDLKDIKQHVAPALANRYAIRSIFPSSQPSSPLRREQNQFNFNDMPSTDAAVQLNSTILEREITNRTVTQVTTTMYDRRIQQVRQERMHSQSPFQTIESQEAKLDIRSPFYSNTPDPDSETSSMMLNATPTPFMPTPTPTPTPTPVEHIPKVCDSCNETGRTAICTAGGLHTPTSSSMHLLAKDFKRRNRMTSYCGNDIDSYEQFGYNKRDVDENSTTKVRRTKSCSSITIASTANRDRDHGTDDVDATKGQQHGQHLDDHHNERRLQKSGKMLAIPTVTRRAMNNYVHMGSQTVEIMPHTYESTLLRILEEGQEMRKNYEASKQSAYDKFEQYITQSIRSKETPDQEQYQLLWLQLQYERYRREIHAERNRRLMGRSRYKRSLEMERDRLLEQLDSFASRNKELVRQIEKTVNNANVCEMSYVDELTALKKKYQYELEQNKCLRQANENLQVRLNDELNERKNINYELESLRGQIFNLTNELQHSQIQTGMGLQCKQELARLEAEFIVMGEVQLKCRDRLAELDNFKARDEEIRMLQESCNIELKDLKHALEEKSSQLDSARHKIIELQAQLLNNEKVITEQKRLLKTVKDEYEEKFKALNKKYEVQKTIIVQMEEKIMMSLHKPQALNQAMAACSPDTDKTDVASSVDRNSPLSTSLASSESLSASLRSTELRNLQQLVETPAPADVNAVTSGVLTTGGATVVEGTLPPNTFDMATSANTASGAHTQHIPNLADRSIGTVTGQNFDAATQQRPQ